MRGVMVWAAGENKVQEQGREQPHPNFWIYWFCKSWTVVALPLKPVTGEATTNTDILHRITFRTRELTEQIIVNSLLNNFKWLLRLQYFTCRGSACLFCCLSSSTQRMGGWHCKLTWYAQTVFVRVATSTQCYADDSLMIVDFTILWKWKYKSLLI